MNEQDRLTALNDYLREINFRPTDPQREVLDDIALGRSPVLVQSASCTGKTTLTVVAAGFLSIRAPQVVIFTGNRRALLPVARRYLKDERNIKIIEANQGGCETLMVMLGGVAVQVAHLIDVPSVSHHYWSAESTPVVDAEMLEGFRASMSPDQYRARVLGEFPNS